MPHIDEKVSLNNASLVYLPSTVEPLKYNRTEEGKAMTAGIMHFGVGAFHRSHQAVYLDDVIANTGSTEWGLVGVGLLPFDLPMRDAMAKQDCLYTVNEKSTAGETTTRIVQAMVEYIYAPDNFEAVVERLVDPAIRIVSLTITEGGYLMNNRGEFLKDHPTVIKDLVNPSLPQSAFGIIIEALSRRRKAGYAAFTVMSCDNLRHNGNQARKACLAFATLRDPELADWIAENVTFPNSMVDRITPAMNPETRNNLNARSGVNDLAPVIAEDFKQWVLEDNFKYGRPSYEAAGVTVTSDVAPYEEAKIRLLNGSHQMLSFPAFLSGHRKVDLALSDPLFYNFIVSFLDKDAGPWLNSIPGMEISSYKSILLDRFQNAAIGDQISRLCLDGGSKIPGFLLPTIEANLKQFGSSPRLAFLLACYNHYIHADKDDLGNQYQLQEPNAMALLQPIIAVNDPMELLKSTHLVGNAIQYPTFVKHYLTCCSHIAENGTRATLSNLAILV
jgi:mannitol 2-dehydrogenase